MLEHELLCIKWGSAKESSWIRECLLAEKVFPYTSRIAGERFSGGEDRGHEPGRASMRSIGHDARIGSLLGILVITIPASRHTRRMGATATSVSCVVSCLESDHPIHCQLAFTPYSSCGFQQVEPTRVRLSQVQFDLRVIQRVDHLVVLHCTAARCLHLALVAACAHPAQFGISALKLHLAFLRSIFRFWSILLWHFPCV